MQGNVELIGTGDSRWSALLRRTAHDFYHRPEYSAFAARYADAQPGAILAETESASVLMPILIRRLPRELDPDQRYRDAVSPYGYSAPLIVQEREACDMDEIWASIGACASEQRLVTAFLRLHPLLRQPSIRSSHCETVQHGHTVWIDLNQPLDSITGGFRSGHKYDIRKLEKRGFSVLKGTWERLPELVAMYLHTMERVGANREYHFADSYFTDLCATLDRHVEIFIVVAPDGRAAAGALFSEYEGIVQYLFSGTANDFTRDAPSKLLIDAAVRWSHARGNRVLHLGGGVGASSDSLYNFKSGFSALKADYRIVRWVFDPVTYAELLGRRGSSVHASGFFPAYRAPTVYPSS